MAENANPLIRKFEHLYPLTAEEKTVLANACSRTVQVAADEDIVREGDSPNSSNLLLEGFVCRYKVTPEGKRQILSFQLPDDLFDAHSFLLDEMDHSIGAMT